MKGPRMRLLGFNCQPTNLSSFQSLHTMAVIRVEIGGRKHLIGLPNTLEDLHDAVRELFNWENRNDGHLVIFIKPSWAKTEFELHPSAFEEVTQKCSLRAELRVQEADQISTGHFNIFVKDLTGRESLSLRSKYHHSPLKVIGHIDYCCKPSGFSRVNVLSRR